MIKLKKNYGRLQIGSTLITLVTPESVIKNLVKQRPKLKVYFDGFEKPVKNGKKESGEPTGGKSPKRK